MIIYGEYSIDEVFKAMDNSDVSKTRLPDGNFFKKNSQRIQLFRKNLSCVDCGISGSVFVLETHNQKITPHMNLYADLPNGKRVLMTKDHIYPRSKGGANEMSNYQTMCLVCNNRKGSKIISVE